MQQVTIFALLLLATGAFCSPVKPQVADKFIFDGQLHCRLGNHWCWEVYAYEHDYNDDDFLNSTKGCRSTEKSTYHVEGKAYGDGLFPMEYELGLLLKHNCTRDGQQSKVELRNVWTAPVGKGKTNKFSMDITLG